MGKISTTMVFGVCALFRVLGPAGVGQLAAGDHFGERQLGENDGVLSAEGAIGRPGGVR